MTLTTYELIAVCSIIIGGGWALTKYLIARIEKGDNSLHLRVDKVDDSSIKRHEFDREIHSIRRETTAIRDELIRCNSALSSKIENSNSDLAGRIDKHNELLTNVLLNLQKRKDDH